MSQKRVMLRNLGIGIIVLLLGVASLVLFLPVVGEVGAQERPSPAAASAMATDDAAKPGPLSQGLGGLPLSLTLLLFLCFLCLLEGALWFLADARRRHQRRVKGRLARLKIPPIRQLGGSLLKNRHLSGDSWFNKIWHLTPRAGSLHILLSQANLSWHPGTFLLLNFLAAATGLGLGLFKWGFWGGLAGATLGALLPYRAVPLKKKLRIKKFEKQLPDALELLARGLKAGHAFTSGLQLVATEMPNPLGVEFLRTFTEFNHGLDLNNALLNLCARMDLRDLRFFTTAVMIQRETGGNLAEILDKIASLIRERFKLRNQIKALTAEGRLSGLILLLLPPVTALALFYLNPDYVSLLVKHRLGRMMAMAALGFQTVGMITIRKIVNIKV